MSSFAAIAIRNCAFVFAACRCGLFGVVVTSFVQIGGVLMIFSYLIVPAVCANFLAESLRAPRAHDAAKALTARELDVLRLIARGEPNKVIAMELGITERTARSHVSKILAKLRLTSRTQAALWAAREGFADEGDLSGAERLRHVGAMGKAVLMRSEMPSGSAHRTRSASPSINFLQACRNSNRLYFGPLPT